MADRGSAIVGSAPVIAALGDPTRLRLVARLCSGGPQSIADLTTGSNVTRQAVTKHLVVLAQAGLVRGLRQGRESRWELEPSRLAEARRHLEMISEEWTVRLTALERHLETMSPRVGRKRKKGKAKRERNSR